MAPRYPTKIFLFGLIASVCAACAASPESGSSVAPPARGSAASAALAHSQVAAPVVTLRAATAELRTLGVAARGHGRVLGVSPDGRVAASVIGVVGAELQVWSVNGDPRIRALKPDIDQMVSDAGFSLDSKELVAAIVGKKPEVVLLSAADASIVARTPLSAGVVGLLDDGSVIALVQGKLVRWDRKSTHEMLALKSPITRLALSPDRKRIAVASDGRIHSYRVEKNAPKADGELAFENPRDLWIADDGTLVVNEWDRAHVFRGKEKRTLPSRVRSVGKAFVSTEIPEQVAGTLTPIAGGAAIDVAVTGVLSPDDTLLVTDNRTDSANRHVAVSLDAIKRNAPMGPGGPIDSVLFGLDDAKILATSGKRLLRYDVRTGKLESAIAIEAGRGAWLFRGPRDIFLWGAPIYRVDPSGPVVVAERGHYASNPRTFRRKDGSVIVCMQDARPRCDLSFTMAADARSVSREDARYSVTSLGDGRAVCEKYENSGSQYGPCVKKDEPGEPDLSAVWLDRAHVAYELPTEPGHGWLLAEMMPEGMATDVDAFEVGNAGLTRRCGLGDVRVDMGAGALHPDGKTIALPLTTKSGEYMLAVIDLIACRGVRYSVPRSVRTSDFSPSGRQLVIALTDQTIRLIDLEP